MKDIARCLVDKHGLKVADAEHFIALMIDVINEGVQRERQVKIKGLGTFKLTSVSSRESVDVNTGERIVIEGRDKISFTPDNAMKELVNRPFSQFETVVINEGVELEDEFEEQLEESTPVEEKTESVEEKTVEKVDNPHEEPVEAVAVVSELPAETVSVEEDIQENNVQDAVSEPVVSEVEKVEFVQGTVETATDTVVKDKVETLETSSEKEVEPVIGRTDMQEDTVQDAEDVATVNTPHKSPYMKVLVSSLVALFVVLVGTICYLFMELYQRNDRIESLMTEVGTLQIELLKKDYSTLRGPSKVMKPVAVAEKPAPVVEKPVPSKKENPYDELNNSDARVRTGAYRIVGVKQVVKVQAGQTLASISRQHLGPGMECYLEVMNKEKVLKKGDRVKIPELEFKRHKKH
ncbi:HU family DNA-binding protein [Segatella oris]|uniref:HU family DNA-binding protein n=1 Tax=Segatella oris TaxID=28135 RepID=UPI0036F3FDE6